MTTLIRAEKICFSYEGTKILDEVDFDLNAGEMVGIIGPNGAGKSTLIRVLAGILHQNRGDIHYSSEAGKKIHGTELSRSISYIPQRQEIYWPLLVERTVALGRFPHLMSDQDLNEEDKRVVESAMEATGIVHLRDRPVNTLSGGERTLVLTARALAVEPKIILADEPVQGLDPNHELQVMEILHARVKSGCGAAVVLHHLNLAIRFCDRLFLLDRGKIRASGKPSDVLSSENLKQSYGIQAHRIEVGNDFFLLPWQRI
ncbi:MAG: ABC transporter ATP-binding protein [Candidatus Omnitrophica bacterium]|nr:ABC transporter ATP-binding protein [Candidatus Omnitrophota bacterium]